MTAAERVPEILNDLEIVYPLDQARAECLARIVYAQATIDAKQEHLSWMGLFHKTLRMAS